jgi:hypothetical protein
MKKDKSIRALIRRIRAQGRAEAAMIFSGLCPETGLDGLFRSSPNADADDYSTYWDISALRKLLCADTEACAAIDRLQGAEAFARLLKSDLAKSATALAEERQAYFRLNEHNNECERQLDDASALLDDIALSGDAYRECTDKDSATGKRIAALSVYVSQFQPEAPLDVDAVVVTSEREDWHMNPCTQGHRDVGAAGGVAHCYQCSESITAETTQEAFEQWNATHPTAVSVPAAI